jgi:hypothetical protein
MPHIICRNHNVARLTRNQGWNKINLDRKERNTPTEKNKRVERVEEERDVRNKRKTKMTRKITDWCGVVGMYCDLER